MTQEEWDNPTVRCVAALIDGHLAAATPSLSVLLLFNASAENVVFTLPDAQVAPGEWELRLDTAQGIVDAGCGERIAPGGKLELQQHALALLTQVPQQPVPRAETREPSQVEESQQPARPQEPQHALPT
jgi:glycogen operon protein